MRLVALALMATLCIQPSSAQALEVERVKAALTREQSARERLRIPSAEELHRQAIRDGVPLPRSGSVRQSKGAVIAALAFIAIVLVVVNTKVTVDGPWSR